MKGGIKGNAVNIQLICTFTTGKNMTMALIVPVKDKEPKFGENCFLAPNATVAGDVKMGDECSVWFTAVVRGDVNSIRIGNRTNIQDGAVIHCTFEKAATTIGNNVSIGHRAIVHGCTVEDDVLIGSHSYGSRRGTKRMHNSCRSSSAGKYDL